MRRLIALIVASLPVMAPARTWNFEVLLDEKPVGRHRFELREGAKSELTSSARFEVKLLGLSIYRYVHDATERWNGDCLERLTARTDDNGERFAVDVEPAGCAMSFAYWNPRILERTRLWNAQTGLLEDVRVVDLGSEPLTLNGIDVNARHYRLTGPKHPIELWYSPRGEWLALASTLDRGRRLRYRLDTTDLPR